MSNKEKLWTNSDVGLLIVRISKRRYESTSNKHEITKTNCIFRTCCFTASAVRVTRCFRSRMVKFLSAAPDDASR